MNPEDVRLRHVAAGEEKAARTAAYAKTTDLLRKQVTQRLTGGRYPGKPGLTIA